MKFATLCFALLIAPSCFAIDAETIRELAKKPHSRENLQRQLAVYADVREYEVSVKAGKPGEELKDVPKMTAEEHTVEGKYIVTQLKPAGVENAIIMVITFDERDGVYRKYVLLPDGTVSDAIGTAAPNVRSISWLVAKNTDGGLVQVLTNEVHSDEKSWWSEVGMTDGKVTYLSEGVAQKKK